MTNRKALLISGGVVGGIVLLAAGIFVGMQLVKGQEGSNTTSPTPTISVTVSPTVTPTTPVSSEDPIWAKLQQADMTIEQVMTQACGVGTCPPQEPEGLYAVGKKPLAFRENLSTGILKNYLPADGDSNYISSAKWLRKTLYFVGKDGVYRLNPAKKDLSALYQTSWMPDPAQLFVNDNQTALISAYYDKSNIAKGKIVLSKLNDGTRQEFTFTHKVNGDSQLNNTYGDIANIWTKNYVWVVPHIEQGDTRAPVTLVKIDFNTGNVQYLAKEDVPQNDRSAFNDFSSL